jgi:hypothetical protein
MIRRHRTNGHSYSPSHSRVFNGNVLSAGRNLVSLISRLNCNCIIIVRDSHISDVDVRP